MSCRKTRSRGAQEFAASAQLQVCRSARNHQSPSEGCRAETSLDRKSTRLNSSHGYISYAVFCLKQNEWTGLRIAGNSVTEIAPPWIPEDSIRFNRANLSVAQFGGRWKVVEGNHCMIDTGASKPE